MSRWYRAYEGTVTDAKLAEAALIAEVSRSVAIAAWHCLLESAACQNNCGSFETNYRRVALILCEPLERIQALIGAYEEIGLIKDGAVSAWKKRQHESDNSTERTRKWREKKRQETAEGDGSDDDETSRDAPEPEPKTETKKRPEPARENVPAGIQDAATALNYVCKQADWFPINDTQRQTALSIINGWLALGCTLELILASIRQARGRDPSPTRSLRRFDSTIRGKRRDQCGGELPVTGHDVRTIASGIAKRLSA